VNKKLGVSLCLAATEESEGLTLQSLNASAT
jgi:hypothetical protein